MACRNEAELAAMSERLKANGIEHERIHEPDAPFDGQLMALGLRPGYKSRFKKFLSNLPLIK